MTEEITEEVISAEQSLRSPMREEPIQETEEEEESPPPIESDSEGLVMARKPSKRKQKDMPKPVSYRTMIPVLQVCRREVPEETKHTPDIAIKLRSDCS